MQIDIVGVEEGDQRREKDERDETMKNATKIGDGRERRKVYRQ